MHHVEARESMAKQTLVSESPMKPKPSLHSPSSEIAGLGEVTVGQTVTLTMKARVMGISIDEYGPEKGTKEIRFRLSDMRRMPAGGHDARP